MFGTPSELQCGNCGKKGHGLNDCTKLQNEKRIAESHDKWEASGGKSQGEERTRVVVVARPTNVKSGLLPSLEKQEYTILMVLRMPIVVRCMMASRADGIRHTPWVITRNGWRAIMMDSVMKRLCLN